MVALRVAAAPRTRRFVLPTSVSAPDSAEAAMEGDGGAEDENEDDEAAAAACNVCEGDDDDMERALSVASLTDGDFFGVCARLLMLLLRDPVDRADDDDADEDGSAVKPASFTISMVIPLVTLFLEEEVEEEEEREGDAAEANACSAGEETTRRCFSAATLLRERFVVSDNDDDDGGDGAIMLFRF